MKRYILSILICLIVILNINAKACLGASWVKLNDNNFIDKDSIKFYVDDLGYINL